jgi:hypothetical protein
MAGKGSLIINVVLARRSISPPNPTIRAIHRKDYPFSRFFYSFTPDKSNIRRTTEQILLKNRKPILIRIPIGKTNVPDNP